MSVQPTGTARHTGHPARGGEKSMTEPAATSPREDGGGQSVGDLVSLAVRDVTRLFRCELDLAKMELRADARRLGLAGALLGIAAFTSFLVLVMLCFALAYGLITDRKSTRLNSSHLGISYAVFCLKKKKTQK